MSVEKNDPRVGWRLVRVGDAFLPLRRIADLAPAERLPVLRAATLAADVEAARCAGRDFAELTGAAEAAFRAFIVALVPSAPPATLAALDFDALYRIVDWIIFLDRGAA